MVKNWFLGGLKLVKVCLHLQKKKIDSQNWFMGVATWRNLHNTTKPVILTALLSVLRGDTVSIYTVTVLTHF
jgi:hypothetical protein